MSRNWLWWLLAPLPLFLPLLWLDPVYFGGNTDCIFYTNILALTSDAVAHGHLHPRWFMDANDGYGSAAMMFYAPLSYVATAVINLPLATLHLGIKTQFLIGIYASQVLSGFAAWLWLKRHFTPQVALAGSLIYVLLPYKLIYIYGHLNLAQLWTLVFLPLWMLAAEQVLVGARGVGLYALALAAVYFTHGLTIMAFGALPALYVMWFGRGAGWFARYGRLAAAHALGLGLCLAQAVPQYYYMRWIHPEVFLAGKYYWKNNIYHIDVLFCAYYGIAALLGVEMARNPALKNLPECRPAMFWVLVLAGVLFLSIPVSGFIWEHVKPLQYLQFPSARLHADALIAVVWLACAWLAHYDELLPRAPTVYRKRTLLLIVGMFGAIILFYLHDVYSGTTDLTEVYIRDAHDSRMIPAVEYSTQWGCISPHDAIVEFMQHKPSPDVTVTSGEAEIKAFGKEPPSRMTLSADVKSQEALLAVRQCYFPTWRAHDDSGRQIPLFAGPPPGLMQLTLPHGLHRVEIVFHENAPSGTAACVASLLSLLACLLLAAQKPAARPAQ